MENETLHPEPGTIQDAKKLGLTEDEFQLIQEKIGRQPTFTELAMYSGMWSEHCSYKNSILLLKELYCESDLLLAERGEENAGALKINDKQAVVFKIESHNHPSAIEPYQGAATGVGGIMRDIFTMGARPLASLNSLRFGLPDKPRNRYLLKEVVKGIGDYGNSLGIPCAGGEIYFHDSYSVNPLVNAMTVGIADIETLASSRASGIGNIVLYVGAKTGRDGIHGASFASKELSEESEEERSAVQVGDPFMEKIVMEATLECIHSKLLVAVQDMGAAGLLSSSSEMSSSGGVGMDIHTDKVPARESGMLPFEYLLSESQERMLMVVEPEKVEKVKAVFDKWELDCTEIGVITDSKKLRVYYNGTLYADLPGESLTVSANGAPRYKRETKKPEQPAVNPEEYQFQTTAGFIDNSDSSGLKNLLVKMVSHPVFASKRPVYEQYDTDIGNMRIIGPGQNGGVYRVPGTDQAIGAVTDCNSFYVSIDPYEGARHAIAESYRNLVASGAAPAGVTNCLNFANPHKPENYYFFERAVKGMSDASETLKLPITSGNVSFYNESAEGPVLPTPTIGMVGLLDDYRKAITGILKPDRDLFLVGHFRPSLEATQYGLIEFQKGGVCLPELDLSKEVQAGQLVQEANSVGFVDAVVDLSMGGMIFALLKMIFACKDRENILTGFSFSLSDELSSMQADRLFWGESAHTYLLSVNKEDSENFENIAEKNGVTVSKLGSSNDSGVLQLNDIEIEVGDLYSAWDGALAEVLH